MAAGRVIRKGVFDPIVVVVPDRTGPRNVTPALVPARLGSKPATRPRKAGRRRGCCGGRRRASRVAHGAVGLAKAAIGLDRAPADVIHARQHICLHCDRLAKGFCRACGCLVAAKIRLRAETCPIGKWGAEAP